MSLIVMVVAMVVAVSARHGHCLWPSRFVSVIVEPPICVNVYL